MAISRCTMKIAGKTVLPSTDETKELKNSTIAFLLIEFSIPRNFALVIPCNLLFVYVNESLVINKSRTFLFLFFR